MGWALSRTRSAARNPLLRLSRRPECVRKNPPANRPPGQKARWPEKSPSVHPDAPLAAIDAPATLTHMLEDSIRHRKLTVTACGQAKVMRPVPRWCDVHGSIQTEGRLPAHRYGHPDYRSAHRQIRWRVTDEKRARWQHAVAPRLSWLG